MMPAKTLFMSILLLGAAWQISAEFSDEYMAYVLFPGTVENIEEAHDIYTEVLDGLEENGGDAEEIKDMLDAMGTSKFMGNTGNMYMFSNTYEALAAMGTVSVGDTTETKSMALPELDTMTEDMMDLDTNEEGESHDHHDHHGKLGTHYAGAWITSKYNGEAVAVDVNDSQESHGWGALHLNVLEDDDDFPDGTIILEYNLWDMEGPGYELLIPKEEVDAM